jgi:hypothetical protein
VGQNLGSKLCVYEIILRRSDWVRFGLFGTKFCGKVFTETDQVEQNLIQDGLIEEIL